MGIGLAEFQRILGGPGRSPGRHAGAAVLSAAGRCPPSSLMRDGLKIPHRTIALLLDHRVEPGQASRTGCGRERRRQERSSCFALLLDGIYQYIEFKRFYPVEALIVGPSCWHSFPIF